MSAPTLTDRESLDAIERVLGPETVERILLVDRTRAHLRAAPMTADDRAVLEELNLISLDAIRWAVAERLATSSPTP